MRLKFLMAALAVALVGLVGPVGTATASPASSNSTTTQVRVCTKTSSGKCIRGGQFCPRAKYRKSGWDAQGRRYVCKGDRSHPHWMRP